MTGNNHSQGERPLRRLLGLVTQAWIPCLFWCLMCGSWMVLLGCSGQEVVTVHRPVSQVAFDQKSKEAVLVLGDVTLPITHPENARSQLQPAMYCEQCRKWYPVPPLDELNRNPGAGRCPRHRTPLSLEGPVPEKTITATNEDQL